jgi:hypothetical protein
MGSMKFSDMVNNMALSSEIPEVKCQIEFILL